MQCLHVSRIKGTVDTFPAGLLCQYLRKYCKFSAKPLLGLSNKRSRPVVRFFYRKVRSSKETDQNESLGWWAARLSKTASQLL